MSRSYRFFLFISIGLLVFALIGVLAWQPESPVYIAPTPAPAPAATVNPAQADLILDLFEPTEDTLNAQRSTTAIASQIEHAMVVSFLLTRCNLISGKEYSKSYNAFIRYAVVTGLAPDYSSAATKVRAIADSASASYSLVYGRVPCTDPSLKPLVKQLTDWRKKIEKTN